MVIVVMLGALLRDAGPLVMSEISETAARRRSAAASGAS